MKNYFRYLSTLLLLAIVLPLSAQDIKLKTNSTKYAETLKPADKEKVVQSLEKLLNEYATTAMLFDKTKRKVTSASVKKFQGLFNPTARVIKDYEEFYQDVTVDVRSYADQVFNRMLLQGIKFKIIEAKLVEITYDPAGFWIAQIEVEKAFFNASKANFEIKEIPSGKYMRQMISVDIKASDIDRAKISGISCVGCKVSVVDNYTRFVGPSLGFYGSSFNPSMSSFWNNNHATSSITTKGGLGFSFGVDFMTNSFLAKGAENKKLFLTAGARFSSYKLSVEVEGFALNPFAETATSEGTSLPYLRSAREIKFTENLSFGVLEIPIGVAYRLRNNNKSSFMLGAKLMPSIVVSGKGDIRGTGTYDATISDAKWTLLEDGATNPNQIDEPTNFGPFQAGVDVPINENGSPSTKGFLLAAQLSPTYFFHLAEAEKSWSLMVGLDLNFHLGSFLSNDNADNDILKYSDDYSSSFLQHYTSGMSAVTYGLRIGLLHRFDRRP